MSPTPTKRARQETLEDQGDRGTGVHSQLPVPLSSDSRIKDKDVCYGTLVDAAAAFLPRDGAPDFRELGGVDADFATLRMLPGDRNYALQNGEGIEFAVLDTRTTTRLNTVRNLPGLSFDAVAESALLSGRKKGANRGRKTFAISVNVYGPISASNDVGCRLSAASAFLQHPQTVRLGVNYYNPQFMTFSDEDTDMNSLVGISNDTPRARNDRISDTLKIILESLEDVTGMREWNDMPEGLKSSLKTYQEDGVRFIQQHEDEEYCQMLVAELSTLAVTRADISNSMSYGGLIADAMGLGKTLTMLTAILSSLPSAEMFGDFYNEAETVSGKFRTKATLIVVTSAQLLENWKDEIQRHFGAGTFDVVTFHGQSRPQDTASLVSADLVLTTYATLAADHKNMAILHKMDWYRVVLDEAHWIRNSPSGQFRAASTLTTSKRWALTGTPIQNKLDDLTSLAEFLRLPPFSTRKSFEKNIIAPLSQGGMQYDRPLRAYLKAYCLRRTDKYLQLPPSSTQTIVLDFSAEERALYRRVFDKARREMDETVSSRGVPAYNRLFMAIMRTRMLCNLGTLPRGREALLPPAEDVTGCERCVRPDEDVAMLLDSFSSCPDCGRSLQLSSPLGGAAPSSRGSDAEYTPGYLPPAARDTRGDRSPASGYTPGYLSPAIRYTPGRLSPASRDGSQDPPSPSRTTPTSTKLSAVVHTVRSRGPGVKHLIFSYWTSTLDPLEKMFHDEGISVVAVDGRTNYGERSQLLKDFREKPEVTVLLMSVGTGAVGLSLTVADAVHIVEPQWNPSVEEQAISRVLRMGQTKPVTIFRYMMRDTIEQNIVSLQKGKRDIARFTLDTGGDSLMCNLEDLRLKLFAPTTESYE